MSRQRTRSKSMMKRIAISLRCDLVFERTIVGVSGILLAIYCAYNVYFIMEKYKLFQTIVSIENDRPVRSAFPGITICAPSIFKPQKLAELFPEFGEKFRQYQAWRTGSDANNETIMEQDDAQHDARQQLFLSYESRALAKWPAVTIIRDLSVKLDDVIRYCRFSPINIRQIQQSRGDDQAKYRMRPKTRQCADIVTVLESIYDGKKCFTYFSDLHDTIRIDNDNSPVVWRNETDKNSKNNKNKIANQTAPNDDDDDDDEKEEQTHTKQLFGSFGNLSQQMIFDLNPNIEVLIKSIQNDIWSSYIGIQDTIEITVHSPNMLQNKRDFIFYKVIPNHLYEISFTKKTTYRLQFPYHTQCQEYHSNRTSFGRFRTQDCCITKCIQSRSNSKCANYYSVLMEDSFVNQYAERKICPHSEQDYRKYLDARESCQAQCPQECIKIINENVGQVRNLIYTDTCDLKWWKSYTENDSKYNGNFAQIPEYKIAKSSVSHRKTQFLNRYQTGPFASPKRRRSQPTQHRRYRRSLSQSPPGGDIRRPPSPWICENAFISISISPKPFLTIRHQPAITRESLMGSIGGHVGIWLGLSLFKVIQFAGEIAFRLLYRLLRNCCACFW